MPKPYNIVVGDKVDVLDTSNERTLVGWVRIIEGGRHQVYVERFKNTMWFEADTNTTNRGRFKLVGRNVG